MKDDNKDLFELMLASNDSEEQFPVLKAFQSYLEAEREKSRRRQSQITICFLVSTIILVVCFCVLGFAFFSKFIEKDNQLTQLLLLERAGIKAVPKEVVVPTQPTTAPVVDSQTNELSGLLAELKKEREALEQLKADIDKKQAELKNLPPVVNNQPVVNNNPAQQQPKEQSVAVDTSITTTIPPAVAPTTTTTTTTTTSTTTTTTIPAPEVVEVQLPRDITAKSNVPKGYAADTMSVTTENNLSLPWHILLPEPK